MRYLLFTGDDYCTGGIMKWFRGCYKTKEEAQSKLDEIREENLCHDFYEIIDIEELKNVQFS